MRAIVFRAKACPHLDSGVDPGSREENASEKAAEPPERGLRAIAGHDTATLEAFSGGLGGHLGVSCQSIRHPVSLRLNAKRGIVTGLGAAASVAFELDP